MQPTRPVVPTAPEYRTTPPPSAPAPVAPPPVPLPRRRFPMGLLITLLLIGGLTVVGLTTDAGKEVVGQVKTKVNTIFPATNPPPVANVPSSEVVSPGFVDIESRTTSANPEVPGKVMKVLVREGATVKKDDEMLRIDDKQAQFAVTMARTARNNAQVMLQKTERLKDEIESELRIQDAVIKRAEQEKELAVSLHKTAKENYQNSTISKSAVDAAENKVKTADSAIVVEKEKLTRLNVTKDKLPLEILLAKNEVELRQTQLEQAEDLLKKHVLRAPSNGKILRVQVAEGDVINGGPRDAAILFCPEEKYIIRAEVQQEVAEDVDISKSVDVEDDVRPGKRPKWTGKVKSVSPWFAPKRQPILEPRQINDVRTQEFIVELDDAKNLRIGQRVRVTFKKKTADK